MDDVKKAQLQKRLIAVLLLIFAGAFAHTLRSMGLFRSSPTPSLPPRSIPAVRSLPVAMETLREKLAGGTIDMAPAPAASPAAPAQSSRSTYTAGSLRDPFQSLLLSAPKPVTSTTPAPAPVAAPQPVAPTLPSVTVQGVVWGDPPPRAIIDNEVYGVGDTVGGAVITAIGRHGVTVELEGRTMRWGVAQGVLGGPTPPQLPPPQMRRR